MVKVLASLSLTSLVALGQGFTFKDTAYVGVSSGPTIFSFDDDAAKYLTAAGYAVVQGTVQNAVNTLTTTAKSIRWTNFSGTVLTYWSNCAAIYPMIGTGATVATFKWNLKDTNSLALTEGGTGTTFTTNGVKGSGSGYLIIGNARSLGYNATNNHHFFVYSSQQNPTDGWPRAIIGCQGTAAYGLATKESPPVLYAYLGVDISGSDYIQYYNDGSAIDCRGPILASYNGSGTNQSWLGVRSTVYSKTEATTFVNIPDLNVTLLAWQYSNLSYYYYTTNQLRGVSIGQYVTNSVWPQVYQMWDAFNNSLSRKTP